MKMNKRENEVQCLERVIKCGTKSRGETKRIINHLIGEDISQENIIRPDFIKYCKPKSKHQKGIIIGIEHFRVDHLSLRKNDGNIASAGAMFQKESNEMYEKWHDIVMQEEKVPDKVIEDLNRVIANQLKRTQQTSYNIFIEAFKYSLNKHLRNIPAYRNNLLHIADNKLDIELTFLIEIHEEFSNLVLNDKKGLRINQYGFMPMFKDVVHLLESIDSRYVKYVILCIGTTLHNDDVKVIAFRTDNIQKQLKNQNITVYEYHGEDRFLQDFTTINKDIVIAPHYSYEGGNINIILDIAGKELIDEQRISIIFQAFKGAYYCFKQNCDYVTSQIVQAVIIFYECYIYHLFTPTKLPQDLINEIDSLLEKNSVLKGSHFSNNEIKDKIVGCIIRYFLYAEHAIMEKEI